jgi:hypothetical protein
MTLRRRIRALLVTTALFGLMLGLPLDCLASRWAGHAAPGYLAQPHQALLIQAHLAQQQHALLVQAHLAQQRQALLVLAARLARQRQQMANHQRNASPRTARLPVGPKSTNQFTTNSPRASSTTPRAQHLAYQGLSSGVTRFLAGEQPRAGESRLSGAVRETRDRQLASHRNWGPASHDSKAAADYLRSRSGRCAGAEKSARTTTPDQRTPGAADSPAGQLAWVRHHVYHRHHDRDMPSEARDRDGWVRRQVRRAEARERADLLALLEKGAARFVRFEENLLHRLLARAGGSRPQASTAGPSPSTSSSAASSPTPVQRPAAAAFGLPGDDSTGVNSSDGGDSGSSSSSGGAGGDE